MINSRNSFNRRHALMAAGATAGLALTYVPGARAQVEKKDVKLAVGGKPLLYYLPLTIAERRGYFKDEGLEVEISDFGGGAKALQSLIGGSADVTTGAYDHTIQMQAKNQPIVAVTELGRFPGIVLALRKEVAQKYKTPADLKGMKIGVTAPGSSTNFMVNYILSKAGLKPNDIAAIGVGAGASAVAAIRRGEIDGLSHLDPVISELQNKDEITIIYDTRTQAGSTEVYGGPYPAAVLYTQPAFIARAPGTTQALVNAFVRSLQWLQKASPAEVADTVPAEYLGSDRALYMSAFERSRPMFAQTGRMEKSDGDNALKVLAAFDPAVDAKTVDVTKTFNNDFVNAAWKKYPG